MSSTTQSLAVGSRPWWWGTAILTAIVAVVVFFACELSTRAAAFHALYEAGLHALLEAVVIVVLVGALFGAAEKKAKEKAGQASQLEELRRLLAGLQQGMVRMKVHESGKTWSEEMRRAMETRHALESIKRAFEKDEVLVSYIESAQAKLDVLGKEYEEVHAQVDALQFVYEEEKRELAHKHWKNDVNNLAQRGYKPSAPSKSPEELRSEHWARLPIQNARDYVKHIPNAPLTARPTTTRHVVEFLQAAINQLEA